MCASGQVLKRVYPKMSLVGREYPLEWITRQMTKAGMVVISAKKMPVLYATHTVKRQVQSEYREVQSSYAEKQAVDYD